MKTIAVIGGGPAGAMAAEKLARDGARVTVFEAKPGWEKPCGGGLTARALKRYAFLWESADSCTSVREAEFAVAGGLSARFRLRRPVAIYSRAILNRQLLGRAVEVGAAVVEDRIVNMARKGDGWQLHGRRETYAADFVVLAAGARSRLRSLLLDDWRARDFMLTFGYYIPRTDHLLRIQVWQGFEGYAWAFPRPDHLSVGICGKAGESGMGELRDRLHAFTRTYDYPLEGAPVFAHLLPSLTARSWFDLRLSGPGWAIAGDTGGLVDPLTGEGIYYAMRSGELLAECLREGCTGSYTERVWRDFGDDLAHAARLSRPFYHGDFLGANLASRMIELARHSATVANVLQDLIEGTQPYTSLPGRLSRHLAAVLLEAATGRLGARPSRLRSAEG